MKFDSFAYILAVQLITLLCLAATIIYTALNFVRLSRTVTTLWEIVKDLQMRKDFH